MNTPLRSAVGGWILCILVGTALLASLELLSIARVFIVSYVGLLAVVAIIFSDRAEISTRLLAVVLVGFVVYVGLAAVRFLTLAAA